MAAINAYFDESHNGDIFCVAGYIFVKSKVKKFDTAWRSLLRKFDLPFFRMSACAPGNKPFHRLSKEQRIEVETNAINLIKEYAERGVAIAIERKRFRTPKSKLVVSPYELCAWTCIVAVGTWLSEVNPKGEVAYFFEAGDVAQGHANNLMYQIFNIAKLNKQYRYSSHAFIKKETCCAVQAADLLAWQFHTECKRKLAGEPKRRKDYESLIGLRHDVVFHDDAAMLARGYLRGNPVTMP